MADTIRTGPTGQTPAQPKHRWWALVVIGLAQLMVMLDASIVSIALPSAQNSLGFDNTGRQWIVTAYSLAFGSLLLLGGRLADLFGRKTTFIIGIAGFAAASAVGGAANGFTMLVVARAVQGLFAALLAPAALSLLTTTFTDTKERARAFGIFGAISSSGGALGLVLGGLLTEYLNWRWTMYVNDAIAVPALIGAVLFIPRSIPAQRPQLDIPGVVLVSSGLFGIVYGFANAETHDWDNWMTWGFLAAGSVLLLAFFLWQTRAKHPVLPVRILVDRDRAASLSALLISSAGMFGVLLFLTYYLQSTLGYSPVKSGVAFLPLVGALMVGSQLATNWLVPKLGPKVVVPCGAVLATGGLVWLTRLDLHSGYAGHVLPPILLVGGGIGLLMTTSMSRATLGVRADDQGVASAAVNTTQQVGGAIGTALLNTLAASAVTDYTKDHLTDPLVQEKAALHSYAVTYWWAAGFFAVALIITVVMFRSKKSSTAPVEGPRATPLATGAVGTGGDDASAIHGRVCDGVGNPAPHTAITVLDTAGRQLARTTSREDGSYAVDTAERGTLVLVGSAPDHQPRAVTLVLNETPVSHDLVILRSTGGLAGTVCGGDGEALSDVPVQATDRRGEVTASTTSGNDGSYRISDLLPGHYTLSASAPGHLPATVPASVRAEDTPGEVRLFVAATLRGRVHSQDGRTPDNARVTLIDAAGDVVATRTTSADGSYSFTGLSIQQYTLITSGNPPVATPVTLNGSHDGVDILLSRKEP
ncbi:MFS transporter [Streptomyces sp. NBC_00028]|uniref:MFS transporter n=1 Tax=Streptomyces sp. NBC_00028 TaxID=2975624 RepID=UPI00324E00B9